MLTRELMFKIFKELNLKNNDTIMIHSSLKAIGKIEGNAEGLIEALKEYFNEGLILLPCHTWATMKEDNQILDLNEENSCVGELPNIALRMGFIRSFHPTHSIVAYGKDAESYIKYDDVTSTPASPNGCFGRLHERNAKILFLGAKLSKNTFIHSIEERFDVPDRFTDKIYHFITKKGEIVKEYNICKHYSSLNPHISDNYVIIEKPMKELGISKYFKFGNADSILVDSKLCYDLVCKILSKDVHAFDYPIELKENLYK